jgi:hypothetical protein
MVLDDAAFVVGRSVGELAGGTIPATVQSHVSWFTGLDARNILEAIIPATPGTGLANVEVEEGDPFAIVAELKAASTIVLTTPFGRCTTSPSAAMDNTAASDIVITGPPTEAV